MSSGFKLLLLSLKIPPGVISNEKEIPPSSSILAGIEKAVDVTKYSVCAFAMSRFAHEMDVPPDSSD